jgi:Terminase large subunit, T4likevirus-type, N-terminal
MVQLATDLATALDPALLMERAGMRPDPWQRDFLRSEARRLALLCSRQSGKSTTTAVKALHTAFYHAGSLILLLSPSLRQSGELFRKVRDVYRTIGGAVPVEQESALRLELVNGSRVVSLPGTEGTVRGFSGVNLLVVDEAARVPDELYYGVRPMLAVSGGRLVCLSTPFGKRGFFYDEWTQGQGWERVKITADQCPRISKEVLAEERAALGTWWYRQEYGCEFVDVVDQVFAYEDVMWAMSDEVQPLFADTGTNGEGVSAAAAELL